MTDRRSWLLYGAYGYTGRLVAERAIAVGEQPVLSGRDAGRLRAMADELDLEYRVADLGDVDALAATLDGIAVVAHCAGPFSATSQPMVDACLASGVHYVDITGEIDVLEAVLARDEEAVAAGVALLPGSGFDVVPTDCLAAALAARMPDAATLELAFSMGGGVSPGTARSALEGIGAMSLCRVGGRIVDVPRPRRRTTATLAGRETQVGAVSWGDVSTAWHSTGINDVFVYTTLPRALGLLAASTAAAVRLPGAGALLRRGLAFAAGKVPAPSAAVRARTRGELWGRVTSDAGEVSTASMTTPNGYDLTAHSVVEVVRRLVAGAVPPGAHTPSQAMGAGFAQELDGVTMSAPS